MGRIFISFLGVGSEDHGGYKSLKYSYNGQPTGGQTQFVQRAEIEAIGPASFDRIIILCTRESFEKFYYELNDELVDELNIQVDRISNERIGSRLTAENQWELFSLVNRSIENGDRLVFDFTHGFRLLSIIMSAALHFILTSKPKVVLEHVFYGQQSENGTDGTIVDMKEFYAINEWSEGVSRVVHGADPSKLISMAKIENSDTTFLGIKNKELVQTLEELTRVIKNVDVNHIAIKCDKALRIVQEQKEKVGSEERDLLDLIYQTFKPLAPSEEITGRYDRTYFEVQLNFAQLLANHGLFMQSYTVMRELIVSIGMLGCTGKYAKPAMTNSDGRSYRYRFGETFFNLCQFEKGRWKWADPEKAKYIKADDMHNFTTIRPFYETLENIGVAEKLQAFTKELADYRNGFDHAWTGKKESFQEVSQKADMFLNEIEQVLESLKQHRIL